MHKLRLGVLGSGKGSNFRAILEAIQSKTLEAEVAIVIADQPEAGILSLAKEAGIAHATITDSRFKTKLSPEVEGELVSLLKNAGVDLVVLAGYMRMVKAPMLEAFEKRSSIFTPPAAGIPGVGGVATGPGSEGENDGVHGALCRFRHGYG